MRNHNYYLYIVTNPRKTVLYTGVTNDLDRRLSEHYEDSQNTRKSFAGRYFCYHLIYYEYYTDVYAAIAREKEIKGWNRAFKEALITNFNPDWRFLESITEQEKGSLPVWHFGEEPLDRHGVLRFLLDRNMLY